MSDLKKEVHFRENTGLQNKVSKQRSYFSGNTEKYRPCLFTYCMNIYYIGVFYLVFGPIPCIVLC